MRVERGGSAEDVVDNVEGAQIGCAGEMNGIIAQELLKVLMAQIAVEMQSPDVAEIDTAQQRGEARLLPF